MISERIKELRLEKGLTQKEIAKNIESTVKNVWAYENNLSTPPIDVLSRYADFFNCSIDYLCGREDDFGIIKKAAEVPALSREETELLTYFKKLNNLQQQKVIGYCYALCH